MKSTPYLIAAARFSLCLIALLLCMQHAWGHGVQVGYGTTPTGFIRIYIEHWHGDLSPSNLGPSDNINVTVTSGTSSSTFNVNVSGTVNNTAASSLPGLVGPITIISQGPSANAYKDWGYWDFAPGTCNQPISVTINQGNSVIFFEETSTLYPKTITGQVFTDQGAPVITAPNISVVGNCVGANVNFNVSVVDDCDSNPTVTYSHASGSFFPVGVTTVTVTATDNTGKTSVKTFTVTVIASDTTPPVITCPANLTLGTDPGLCGAVANFAATATDNCSNATVSYSHAPGSVFPVGSTVVTATATDASGNTTSCTFTVTVQDTTPPVITFCPSPTTVECDGLGNLAARQAWINSFQATDNCGPVTLSYAPANVGSTKSFPDFSDLSGFQLNGTTAV
ncbi:MAG: HYR domain-containing protein, partial [Verrucomicrobiota bacterium]